MSFFGPPPEFPDPERFEPPPWGPPIWDRPAEDTLGISVGVTALLAANDEIALVFDEVRAFPNGFAFALMILRNPNIRQDFSRPPMHFRRPARVGFTFADGATATSEDQAFPPLPGRAFNASMSSVVVGGPGGAAQRGGFDDEGVPTGHVIRGGGGGGGMYCLTHEFWCFRLPPAGPMTVHADLPGQLDEVSVELDATPIVEASTRSFIIWPRS